MSPLHPSFSETRLILLAGLLQFVNILDFMMVMPLGPDFARALNIPASEIGLIGGSYTFAASIAGLISALFLDHYARKTAILVFLGGLALATLGGAVAWDRDSMVAVRLLAGAFGGPLTSLSASLIADYIPPERRGAAMGKVMGAFAAASVLGVPFGLELAQRVSWHAPFLATGALAFAVLALVWAMLPYHAPLSAPSPMAQRLKDMRALLASRIVWASYALMALSMMSAFMIVPNISAHLQLNLNYPREHIGLLYLCGGTISFFGMRAAGRWMDRSSATRMGAAATALLALVIYAAFVGYPTPLPIVALFMGFMFCTSARNVCGQALSSKIPAPAQRAAFMSVQSSMTHMAAAAGAYGSSLLLVEKDGLLLHMPAVGTIAIGISLLVPPLFYYIESHLKRPH